MKAQWLALKKRYWDDLAPRERHTIAIGALVLSPVLAYFLLWQPASTANAKLNVAVPQLRIQAALLRAQAAEVDSLRHQPHLAVLDAGALKAAVEESAVRHQLRDALSGIDVQPPAAVRITIASISFRQWLNWLRNMQQEQHIRADSVAIAPLPQAGMVKVSATLTNGGE